MTICSTKQKIKEWVRRYMPVEAGSLGVNLVVSWAVCRVSGSVVIGAVSGAIAGMVCYYSVCTVREFIYNWRLVQMEDSARKVFVVLSKTARDVAVEFGIFGVIDGFITRPAIMLGCSSLTSVYAVNIVIGKILADALYYSFAIGAYELKKRYWRRVPSSAPIEAS
jgi:hypothetical protein